MLSHATTERASGRPEPPRVGALLREWRTRRAMSQFELALEAGVSARHICFVETGRSRPSAAMIGRLADTLAIPPRERDRLLLAAGHAPEGGAEASQLRLVEAADEARRRIERDLHDGAQQRFVLALLWLKRAADRACGTAAEPLVAEALEHVKCGLAELRDLAHGIHPTALSERGLAAALTSLAQRSPLPVELDVQVSRVAPTVEAAIYFTVAEALTNVAKHAHATHARVTVAIEDGRLVAEIVDDGIGGAGDAAGAGLRGLVDRLAALRGTLTVESARGGGTRILASAPVR
jgi:signal transduction histidine kinase